MTYDEIMTSLDLGEKEEQLIKYYIEDVKVLEWLQDDAETQIIFFKDRIETKKQGKLHSLKRPAIKYKDGSGHYYIEGELYEKDEWEIASKKIKRLLVLDKITTED